jgi:hypothetical protein
MALPNDMEIVQKLVKLLNRAPAYTMRCNDVYEELAKSFPSLTYDEKHKPYRRSKSHWANRVQWARQHCVKMRFIFGAKKSPEGRGYWTLTDAGSRLANIGKSN